MRGVISDLQLSVLIIQSGVFCNVFHGSGTGLTCSDQRDRSVHQDGLVVDTRVDEYLCEFVSRGVFYGFSDGGVVLHGGCLCVCTWYACVCMHAKDETFNQ